MPELLDMLNEGAHPEDMLAVMTQTQARRQQEEEEKLKEGDRSSGATPRAVSDVTVHSPSEYQDTPPFDFDPELFEPTRPRVRKTRRAKREERRAYVSHDVQSLSRKELMELQQEDDTLATVRENLKPLTEAERGDFYEEDGLLYH